MRFWENALEVPGEDGDVFGDLVFAHKLKHVASGVGCWFAFSLHEFDVH